jgi:hypothetical protein
MEQTQFLTQSESLQANIAQTQNDRQQRACVHDAVAGSDRRRRRRQYNQALAQSQQYSANGNSAQTSLNTEDKR